MVMNCESWADQQFYKVHMIPQDIEEFASIQLKKGEYVGNFNK